MYELPWAYNGQIIEYFEQRARELLGVKCAYLREDTCPNAGFSPFENLRNHCADVPLLAKLLQVAHLVKEPDRADIFLVPFLMGCNSMLSWGAGLERSPSNRAAHDAFYGDFAGFSRRHLPHFSTRPHRHLFLFPLDSIFMASLAPFCPDVTPQQHAFPCIFNLRVYQPSDFSLTLAT